MDCLLNNFNQLYNIISSDCNPFNIYTIVVPNRKVSDWFKINYLKKSNKVLMNAKFITLNDFFASLINNNKKLVNKNIVKLYLIKYFLNTEDYNKLNILISNYLKGDKNKYLKIFDLADSLSDLFMSYILNLDLDKAINYNDAFKYVDNNIKKKYIYLSSLIDNKINLNLDYIYFFNITKLSKCEQKLLDQIKNGKYEDHFISLDYKDLNYNLISILPASSKIREIEWVHSKICNLLLKNKDLTYSDFLVLAPDISVYKSSIATVFKQDGVDYVNIPYVICYKDKNDNLLYKALKTLFDIYVNKSFTKIDFISLLDNKLILKVRNIDDDSVAVIKNVLVNSNTFRNKEDNSYDDWELLKRRLLTSKILLKSEDIDSSILFDSKEYISFTAIDLNDDTIIDIISLIDDLKEIIALSNLNDIDNINLDKVKLLLDKFFSIKENGFESNSEYIQLLHQIDFFKKLEINFNKQSLSILFLDLLSIASNNKFINGSMFTSGITFLDLDFKTILHAKYVFILGLDSKSIDLKIHKTVLDIKDDKYFIENINENKNLFKLICSNADNLYISYVYEDLKTGEEFFPHPLIEEINNKNIKEEKQLTIDEKRDSSQIFTRREQDNKKYLYDLLNSEDFDE